MAARQEMMNNRVRDQRGTVQQLIYGPEPVAPAPAPITVVTKPARNFARENKLHVRLLAAENKAKSVVASQDKSQEPTASGSRYSDVDSRYKETERSCSKQTRRFDYLRSRSKLYSSTGSSDNGSEKDGPTTSPSGHSLRPTSSAPSCSTQSQSGLMQCDRKNFIKYNEQTAKISKPLRGNADFFDRSHGYLEKLERLPKAHAGEVPSYLRKRQEDWRQEKLNAEVAAEMAHIPAGCQLMEEDEKKAIIDELQRAKAEKELELYRLPIRNDTLRARMKRQELETTLTKLDEHLELLAKPKVYVPIEPSSREADSYSEADRSCDYPQTVNSGDKTMPGSKIKKKC